MKIVGDSAVIPLSYPFAFVSPLAKNSTVQNTTDGALMEHFPGPIVETCQTVNSTHWKNHGDSTLMKRVRVR